LSSSGRIIDQNQIILKEFNNKVITLFDKQLGGMSEFHYVPNQNKVNKWTYPTKIIEKDDGKFKEDINENVQENINVDNFTHEKATTWLEQKILQKELLFKRKTDNYLRADTMLRQLHVINSQLGYFGVFCRVIVNKVNCRYLDQIRHKDFDIVAWIISLFSSAKMNKE
jgi:hypothetical protein